MAAGSTHVLVVLCRVRVEFANSLGSHGGCIQLVVRGQGGASQGSRSSLNFASLRCPVERLGASVGRITRAVSHANRCAVRRKCIRVQQIYYKSRGPRLGKVRVGTRGKLRRIVVFHGHRTAVSDVHAEPFQLLEILLHTTRNLPRRASSLHRARDLGPTGEQTSY